MAIRHLTSIMLACCAGTLLSGCARMGAMSRVDPVSIAVYPGGRNPSEHVTTGSATSECPFVRGVNSYASGAINLDCFLFPEDRARNASDLSDREQWNLPADGSHQRGVRPQDAAQTHTTGPLAYSRAVESQRDRNRLTALLLKQSDDICVVELGRLNSNEAAVNSSLSILATAATTTANIVTGELAQSILTGVGTFAGASRSHIDAFVYRNTVPYAISRAITIERTRLREAIEGHYRDEVNVYTIDQAIRAVNEYHGTCSFYKGLELVLASVEGDQRSREAERRRTQIDELDQQIRRYREQLVGADDAAKKPILEHIEQLNGRIQELVLAGVPAPAGTGGATQPNGSRDTQPQGQQPGPQPVSHQGEAQVPPRRP